VPSIQVFVYINKIPSESSVLQAKQSQLSAFPSSPLVVLMALAVVSPVCSCLSCNGECTALQVWHNQCCVEGRRITSLSLLTIIYLMQPRILLASFATRAHCWIMVKLVSIRTPRSFSAKLFSSWVAPSVYCCMGLFLPRCRTLHFPWLSLRRFPSAHFSSLLTSLWVAAQHSGISEASPSFVSSASLLIVQCVPHHPDH